MTEQLSLLMGARNSDPRSSHEANAAVPRNRYYAVIFDLMTWRVDATADDLVNEWPKDWPQDVQRGSVSKRLGELVTLGELEEAGFRRNHRGRSVLVYRRPVRAA